MPTPVAHTEITIPDQATWVDVDVTSQLGADAGSVAGLLFEVVNTSATEYDWGIRNNNSTDNIVATMEDAAHLWVAIGCDSNDVFEFYSGNTASIDVYLIGYLKDTEATFLTNVELHQTGTDDAWVTVDLSATTSADTAIVTFWQLRHSSGSNHFWGLRETGSSDNRVNTLLTSDDLVGGMMSVNSSENIDIYLDFQASATFPYLCGWAYDNVKSFADAKVYSTATTGSYVDTDMSTDIPAGWNAGFFDFSNGQVALYQGAIRKKGSAFDEYRKLTTGAYGYVEVDDNKVVQQKISDTNLDLYLWGYSQTETSAVVAVKDNLFMRSMMGVGL